MADPTEVPYEPMEPGDVIASPEPDLIGARVASMLNVLGIKRVVCVDDLYALDAPRVLALTSSLSGIQRLSVLGTASPGDAEGTLAEDLDDYDVWRSRLLSAWESLGPEQRLALYRGVAEVIGDELQLADVSASGALARVFSSTDLKTIGLGEWEAQKDDLIASAREIKTLFLFDRNFSGEGGGETAGEGLARQVIELSENAFDCWVGLLTHTVSVEEQQAEWRKKAREVAPNNPSRFVVISKKTLEPDTAKFDEMLRVVFLGTVFQDLLQRVRDAAEAAHKDADETLENLSPYELEVAVFKSSAVEGVWEPDTLVRLYGLAELRDTHQRLRSDDAVHDLARRIRDMVGVADDDWSSDRVEVRRIRELQRLEILHDAAAINEVHLPLELGDIFERLEGGKRFVLVAPPCDLMIRDNGERRRAMNTGVLAEIRFTARASGYDEFPLPLFDLDEENVAVVDVKRTCVVPLNILDLSVFRADGFCSFDTKTTAPKRLLPYWDVRFGLLKEQFAKAAEALRGEAGDTTRSRTLLNDLAPLGIPGPFKVVVEPSGLSFGFKRTGRIRSPYANALLTRFANYFTRDAFEHDLTRTA